MTPLMLMLIAGAGIALLLFLVLKYKFQPFVALMLVAYVPWFSMALPTLFGAV